jgi:hypothetical protein
MGYWSAAASAPEAGLLDQGDDFLGAAYLRATT